MSGQSNNEPDLTTPEAVAAGQQVYDQIVAGDVPAADVAWHLDTAYGQTRND
jgi:hypothetical protein